MVNVMVMIINVVEISRIVESSLD